MTSGQAQAALEDETADPEVQSAVAADGWSFPEAERPDHNRRAQPVRRESHCVESRKRPMSGERGRDHAGGRRFGAGRIRIY